MNSSQHMQCVGLAYATWRVINHTESYDNLTVASTAQQSHLICNGSLGTETVKQNMENVRIMSLPELAQIAS